MHKENDRQTDLSLTKRKQRSWLLFLLGLAVMVLGVAFCWLLGRGFLAARAYDAWVATPAVVVAAWIEGLPQPGSEPDRYEFKVRYRYEVAGESLVSTRLREIESNTRRRAKVESLLSRFGVGTNVTCFVNPTNSRDALLLKPTKAPGYTLWFPGLFAVGGAGMCVVGLRRNPRKHQDR